MYVCYCWKRFSHVFCAGWRFLEISTSFLLVVSICLTFPFYTTTGLGQELVQGGYVPVYQPGTKELTASPFVDMTPYTTYWLLVAALAVAAFNFLLECCTCSAESDKTKGGPVTQPPAQSNPGGPVPTSEIARV